MSATKARTSLKRNFSEPRVHLKDKPGKVRLPEYLLPLMPHSSTTINDSNLMHEVMDRAANHTCPVCSLAFSRSSHLQRHYDTHTAYKAWKCDFCASQFKRSDALRKHWKSCSLRKLLGEAIPAQLPPGRRRRACDRCAANKQGCDQVVPCSNCAAKSYPCSYERASNNNISCNRTTSLLDAATWNFRFSPIGSSSFPLELSNKRNETQFRIDNGHHSTSSYNGSPTSHVQIGFIVQLTKYSGLYQVFNYTSPNESPKSSLENNALESRFDWRTPMWFDIGAESFNGPHDSSVIETSRMASWISHPLFSRSTALWSIVQENPLFKSSALTDLDAQCTQDNSHIEFFNPFNLERYLRFFWDRWSIHWPCIHRPSFDLDNTPTFMILIMVLTGCFMSNNAEDASNAKKWLEIAEWIVFQQLSLWSTFKQSPGEDSNLFVHDRLRLLQSALLVCTVQHWEGLRESKERIRDQRFPAVVAAARELGFDRAKHTTDIDLDQMYVDWPQFVLNEELIRTHTYIFLFDNQYAIFHGIPPRIMLSELDMALPYPEPCFKAPTSLEFLSTLEGLGYPPIRNITIRDMVELLCSESAQHIKLQDLAGMSVLSLITLVVAIQAAILCQTMSLCISPSTISALRGSLTKWNSAWEKRLLMPSNVLASDTDVSLADHANPDGWLRHAPEYYRVASLMLDKLSSKAGKSRGGGMLACPSPTSQLEEILELVT